VLFLMKKLYRGCIWVIILLPIMASQSVFATQTIDAVWEQTSLSNNIWGILENNAREEIIESQYAFTLTGEAEVTTRLTAFADTYVYLFLINSSGQLELVHREDGSGTYINSVYYGESVIQRTLSSGDYFIVPTTYNSETYSSPKAYVLEITIVSNSGNLIPEAGLVNPDGSTPNDASQFSGDTNGSGNEDSSINGTLTATDVEGLSGSYFSVTSNPTDGTASIGSGNGIWQYTPILNYFGEDQFTVTATDDVGGMTDQVISLTVIPVDDAALFSGDTSAIGDEDTEISGTLQATDVENLSGSYFTVTSDPTNGIAAIDGETGEWLYRPIDSYSGEDAFTVTVTDDTSGTTTQVISITVNSVDDPAIFSGNFSGAGNEDMAINGTLTASDVDGLTDDSYFTVTTGPSNGTASISSGNGIWQYTPILNYFGEDQFTVTVTDDLDGTTDQVISVIVTPVDDVAFFSGNTSGEGQEDNPVTGTLAATDIDGLTDDSYYTVTEDPLYGTATIDQTSGFWQYTPQSNYFGSDAFTITVTDDRDGTSAQTINISLSAYNDAPIITSNALATATENQLYSYSVTTSDVEGDNLSLSVTSIPDWLSFNAATGVLSGTPVHMHAEIGTHGVVIRADDGIDSVEQSFTITVQDVNNPANVTLIASNFIEDAGGLVAGASAAASYQIEDLDGDELTVTFEQGTNGNNHYSLDTAEQKIFLTQVGIDTINIGNQLDSISLTVVEVQTNSSGGSSSQPTGPSMPDVPLEDPFDTVSSSPGDNLDGSSVSATVTPSVTPINDRPTAIPKTGASTVVATEQIQTQTITLEGTDEDSGAPAIFLITGLPLNGYLKDGNIQITGVSPESPYKILGTLTYKSTSHTAKSDSFTFKANDGQLDSDLATVSITITPVNDAPGGEVTISGIVAQGQILTAKNELTDADGLGTISYQWRADNQNIAGANQSTYQLMQADINKVISVIASYTDTQKTQEAVTSSNTTTQILDQALSQLRADINNNLVSDYVNAGIIDVTDSNLISINNAMKPVDTNNQNQAQIQQLVVSYNNILNYAADSLTSFPPIADDFSNIGVDDVTQDTQAISLLNDVIALGDKSAVDTIAKLQALMTAVTSVLNLPEGQIDTLSKQQLELLGVEGVTDDNLLAIRQMITSDNQAMDKLRDIQGIVDKVVASHKIQAYSANSSNNSIPTLDDYKTIGLTDFIQADIDQVNSMIKQKDALDIDNIAKIIALLTADTDGDSTADIFDSFPHDPTEESDLDGDSIGDNADNCPNAANTNQANFDADAMGDACDPDVDNDGIASVDDAFKFNAAYSSDTDGDGMPDAYELEHGFDANNVGDKNTDSDGDGVSNLNEFIAGTDPRVNPIPGLPKLVIPNDIQVISTGRMTAVDIGTATAADGSNVELQPVASFTGPL
jgi:VCBS repeat-containing protein